MKSKRRFYVYVLLDPRKPGKFRYGRWVFDYLPFYVGKGTGKRAYIHLSTQACLYNLHKHRTIRKIFSYGLTPIVVLKKKHLTEKEAFSVENKLILRIGRKEDGGPLTNKTVGGEGSSGHRHSRKTRKKISESLMGRPVSESTRRKISLANTGNSYSTGYRHSRKTLEKRSISRKGYVTSEETKTKIRQSLTGYKHNEQARRNMGNSHLGFKHSEKSKKQTSMKLKGRVSPTKGRVFSQEERQRIADLRRTNKILRDLGQIPPTKRQLRKLSTTVKASH